jgi:hypothetical protein
LVLVHQNVQGKAELLGPKETPEGCGLPGFSKTEVRPKPRSKTHQGQSDEMQSQAAHALILIIATGIGAGS